MNRGGCWTALEFKGARTKNFAGGGLKKKCRENESKGVETGRKILFALRPIAQEGMTPQKPKKTGWRPKSKKKTRAGRNGKEHLATP